MEAITIADETIRSLVEQARGFSPGDDKEALEIEAEQLGATVEAEVTVHAELAIRYDWHSEVCAYEDLSELEVVSVVVDCLRAFDDDGDELEIVGKAAVERRLEDEINKEIKK